MARKNTEGFYADRNMHAGSGEFIPIPDVAIAVGAVTRSTGERIAYEAFRIAQNHCGSMTIAQRVAAVEVSTAVSAGEGRPGRAPRLVRRSMPVVVSRDRTVLMTTPSRRTCTLARSAHTTTVRPA